ncbi:MAG TPA: S4 domain-containing protein [Terriglobia bacterium]|nr:S4 domain-containing protein [Terriglobia bacterium]
MSRAAESRVDAAPEDASMRLDLFLKVSRLIPRRSLAQEVCDHGGITVNGVTAKRSRLVRAGDLIQWRQRQKMTAVKVAQIPRIRPGKTDAAALYEAVRTEDAQ